MSYQSWSVVFGEQPSAAKWNILGTNDSSFNDGTGIANLEIGSGHTSMKIDYKFSVYRNAAQNTSAGTFAILQADTKLFDTSTNVDVATNKGRFTAPVAGFYYFAAQAETAAYSGTGYLGISLFKNGTQILNGQYIDMTAFANAIDTAWIVSGMLQLSANDYVEAQVYASATVALAVGNSNKSYFQGFLISQT